MRGLFNLVVFEKDVKDKRVLVVQSLRGWVPISTDLVVVLSGIVEVALGLSLIVLYKLKAFVGWATAIFFILIFPGNISQYVNEVDAFGSDTDNAWLIGLFFQPILVVWALWSTGAFKSFMNRNKQIL